MKYNIKAAVIDIRYDSPNGNDSFLLDTNVLYWLTYSRASQSNHAPARYQTKIYPSYIIAAMRAKSKLMRCELSFAELAYKIEQNELQLYKGKLAIDDIKAKEFRHNYPEERQIVIDEIKIVWNQVKSIAASTVNPNIDENTADRALLMLNTYPIDVYDALILDALSKTAAMQIISDDGDFATVDGITVFTANNTVINLAKKANRLMKRS